MYILINKPYLFNTETHLNAEKDTEYSSWIGFEISLQKIHYSYIPVNSSQHNY